MKKIHLVLCGILALQFALLAVEKFTKADYTPHTPIKGDKLFPDAKSDAIIALKITQEGRTTELKREGEKWVVASEKNALADVQACKNAVQELERLAPGYIVAEKPEKHEQFEVAGKNAVEVTATNSAGVTVANFIMGKTTPDFRGVYVRTPPTSTDVMKVDSNIRPMFCKDDTKVGAWRDKSLFSAEPKDIRSFELTRADETISIERVLQPSKEKGKEGQLVASDDDTWNVTKPITASLDKFTGGTMARNLATLKADGFAPADKTAKDCGLEPPVVKVVAKLEKGDTLELEIGKDDSGKVYARKPGGEIVTVQAYQLYNFQKKSSDFKPPEPPKTDPPANVPAPEPQKPTGG